MRSTVGNLGNKLLPDFGPIQYCRKFTIETHGGQIRIVEKSGTVLLPMPYVECVPMLPKFLRFGYCAIIVNANTPWIYNIGYMLSAYRNSDVTMKVASSVHLIK